MRRPAGTLLAAAMLVALLPASPAAAAVRALRVVDCRQAACWPAAFTFTPNGSKIFYVERYSGQIRVHNLGTGSDHRWATIPGIGTDGEQGLVGIALDPRWPRKEFAYAYHTNAAPLENRIVRIRKGGGMRTLLRIPASGNHNGGVIHFGPDGMLYAVTGDAGDPSRSQDRDDAGGKVLRMTKTGKVPASNPFPGSHAFSYGHRNSFGFAFDPESGDLWQSENGPECTDEVNRVVSGGNYGWGSGSACTDTSTEGPDPIQPEHTWNPVIAPTGVAFCDGCGLGSATEGTLLVGDYNTGRIHRLTLTESRLGVTGEATLYSHEGFVIAVEASPDGEIYFSDDGGIFLLRRR